MPDTSGTSATRAARMWHERHECNSSETGVRTSATRVLHKRHECNTSRKILILITTRVKTYFYFPIFIIWQVKDYKERNNFILSAAFGNASFPCQNAFENCATKTELCTVKAIKKTYTLDCSCKFPCTFPHN